MQKIVAQMFVSLGGVLESHGKRVALHPTLVGAGQRLFDDCRAHVALDLIEDRPPSTGGVFATYQPESS